MIGTNERALTQKPPMLRTLPALASPAPTPPASGSSVLAPRAEQTDSVDAPTRSSAARINFYLKKENISNHAYLQKKLMDGDITEKEKIELKKSLLEKFEALDEQEKELLKSL